jgi:thiol:disulfide interchange protein DsbD
MHITHSVSAPGSSGRSRSERQQMDGLNQSSLAAGVLALCVLALVQSTAGAAEPPLPADQVFHLAAKRGSAGEIVFDWSVASGAYLYRDSLSAASDGHDLALTTPPAETKDDPNFGPVEVYHREVIATLAKPPATGTITLSARGCAEQGICYPVIEKTVDAATLAISSDDGTPTSTSISTVASASGSDTPEQPLWSDAPPSLSPQPEGNLAGLMRGDAVPMLLAFLGFGILLAFTPCVFPMLPILSGLILGTNGRQSLRRSLTLSASYVVAAAAAYAMIGLMAGWTGSNLQLSLQSPAVLLVSAGLFVLLALSMFGLFEIWLPERWQRAHRRNRQRGTVLSAAALGFGSALVVSPCVTPPLAAAILYAGQTGDAIRGGAALFALGIGMGLPLVAFALFGASVLPKAGAWLAAVRPVFGVVFLGIAILIVSRLVAAPIALAFWGTLAIGSGIFLGAFDRHGPGAGRSTRLRQTTGLIGCLYGALLVIGASAGAEDPFRPLGFLARASETSPVAALKPDIRVSSLAELAAALASERQPSVTLLSFTANWCTSCKSNEAVMRDPAVRAKLQALDVIDADVTEANDATRKLMARYAVVGPPTLLLIDRDGHEIAGSRLTGPLTLDTLTATLEKTGT